jgi:hypothetical protein
MNIKELKVICENVKSGLSDDMNLAIETAIAEFPESMKLLEQARGIIITAHCRYGDVRCWEVYPQSPWCSECPCKAWLDKWRY